MNRNIERTQDGVSSLIDTTRDAVIAGTHRAENGIDTAAERLSEKAHGAGESVRSGAESASRGAHHRLEDVAQRLDRGYTRAQADLTRAATTASDYVAGNPGKSLLVAVSAGFLTGMLVKSWRPSA